MRKQQKWWIAVVVAVVVAFLAGFSWQYFRAETLARQLAEAEEQLAFTRLQARIGAATIEAQAGNYEIARQLASDFFTGLQDNIAEAPESAREELRSILARRDPIITDLSRANPGSGAILATIFTRYRAAAGEPDRSEAVPAPGPAAGE